MDFRRFLQIPMLEMTEHLKNMQDGMHPRNGTWRRTAENLQKYVLFFDGRSAFLQDAEARYAVAKMQDELQENLPAIHKRWRALCKINKYRKCKLYKTLEFAERMRIMKTVKRNESLRKCSVGFKTEERVMLSILAVCGAAYLAGMVAMTMHGMKN